MEAWERLRLNLVPSVRQSLNQGSLFHQAGPNLTSRMCCAVLAANLIQRPCLAVNKPIPRSVENPCIMSVSLESVEEELNKRHPPRLTVAAAVDGSQMSDMAAKVAASFVNMKRGDKLVLIHVSSPKSYLPRHLQPAHLRNYYQDLAAASKVGLQAEWMCREKDEGQSTCEALTHIADKKGVDMLVAGSFGRKGEKLDLLGSVADYSLRSTNSSMCIVRSTGNRFDKQAKFVFSTDGSHAAALAFVVLVKFLVRPLDIVHVVMVSTTDGVLEQKFVEQYKTYMDLHKVPGTVSVKCIDRLTLTVPDGILEAAKDLDADVLVLGISGYSKKKLGSVSEDISARAHCTTLIIKDSYEVMPQRYSRAGAGTLAREFLPSTPRD